MDNQQERLARLGWAGGIIDGEGNLTIAVISDTRRRNPMQVHPLFKMSNTSSELVDRFCEILKENDLAFWRGSPNQKIRSPKYKLQEQVVISGFKRMKRFLAVFKPVIFAKWRQVATLEELIEYRMTKPYHLSCGATEQFLVDVIRQLNFRGVPQESSETNTLDSSNGDDRVRTPGETLERGSQEANPLPQGK